MLDLKLFTDLQGDTTASLLLKPGSPGMLQFFVISSSVNYSVVVSGECAGELPGNTPISFDVVLSTIAPLLNKSYKFRLAYSSGVLQFVDEEGKFSISPLCVEHISDYALETAQKYIDFTAKLSSYESVCSELNEATARVKQLEASKKQDTVMSLSGFTNSGNPWSEPKDSTAVEDYYAPLLKEAEDKVKALELLKPNIAPVSLDSLKRISTIAARNGSTISMCDSYAVVDLQTAFVIQKADCGTRSVQGKLLRRLLVEPAGKFYELDGDLVFVSGGKKSKSSITVVFISSYLPNTAIDSTIVTKGAVKEKYMLNLKGMLAVLSVVSNKFDTMVFDMGSSKLRLLNDRGEELTYQFEVEDAKTIELNKLLRGESAGRVEMSNVEIPKAVQRILPLLEDKFTVYVKDRKIVLQSDTLYVVFGR